MDTDQEHFEPRISMARIRALDSDPEQSEARPDSGAQNPCSSVFICGSLLQRCGLELLVRQAVFADRLQ